jgi:hypothetical protein
MQYKNEFENTNLAKYAELYIGLRKARKFKYLDDGKLKTRLPDYDDAVNHLEAAIEQSRSKDIAFSNITLNKVMNGIADIQLNTGNVEIARDTIAKLKDLMNERKASKSIIREIEQKHDSNRPSNKEMKQI